MKTVIGWFGLLVIAGMVNAASPFALPNLPKEGDKAPLFEGKDAEGNVWKLADALGKKTVLLYFYPKDGTPGCLKEACGYRDQMSSLQDAGVEVVGVSMDSAASHKKFIADNRLNFTLLTDAEGKIVELYGVRLPAKNMARRVSFLIDKEGKIAHVTDDPMAETHLTEMKAAAARLKGR
jgi:thioredoxin-dependent peroxiredoxin